MKTNSLWKGLSLGGALGLALAGCGSSPTPGTKTAASKSQGSRSSGGDDDAINLAASQSKEPVRKMSDEEKEDFSKALATYQELKKGGRIDPGDCDKAARVFARAADENPSLREARYNQAAVLMECGRQQEAVPILERLANGSPPYAPALTSVGYIAWKNGDTITAERQFNRAIELDQKLNSVAARNNLAQILRDRVQHASGEERTRLANQASTHLRSVLALDGNNLQAYATLTALYHDIGYLEMSQLVGKQAVARAEEIATGRVVEEKLPDEAGGGKRGKGKDKEKTETAATTKVSTEKGTGYTPEMKQQLALVFNTMGLVDLKKKNVTGAIANFRRAIDQDPSLNEARMNLAAVSLNFRDYKTAEENFRAVLSSQPKNFEAAIGLGVALRGGKKIDEAEQQYLAAQKIDPQNMEPAYNLGLLYQDYKGGERASLQKAQQYYRDFLSRVSAGTPKLRKDAEKRIKDIDEMFKALDEAEKLQKEAEEMQRKAEEQQKKMEEEMKKQDAAAAAGAAAPAGTAPPPAEGAPAAGAAPDAAGGGKAKPAGKKKK